GHRIAYTPAARVIHSHERGARYELLRTYAVHRRLAELFDLGTVPTLGALARSIGASLALHRRLARGAPAREILRATALAFAWPLGQYLGARAHQRGWRFRPRGI